ncbi:hypothetical protein COV24_01960 [candidate division WWE3 bacterium CG10_big_fil_rev_8_21_14_0_10_32_10]|uniref:Glycosyltransferase family 4 protein n=1 Tax=candidate division WWE3 bacterium CG10_big_fil_rev_8_21_14_0_10_32_10 TaxID=1975090 RepID=A0A2H0RAR0_UNCKA|nr:MAG: hypothetical protein COV24_01960 [candidate division WWE3 bacterium CG10_big_fil_rev_8_21_14_0_10_32_10]
MKILIYSSKYPPQIGGVENVVYNLSKEFVKSKNTVCVIAPFLLQNESKKMPLRFLTKGFRLSNRMKKFEQVYVKEIFMSLPRSFLGFLSFPYRFLFSIIKTRYFIKKFNPDVINFHFPDDSLYYFYFSTIFLKYPIYINIHGNELHLFSKNKIYRLFLNKLLSKCSGIVVNSIFMEKELGKIYFGFKDKINIIRNGIDLDKFSVKTKVFKNSMSYFLFIGRFDYKKGLDILIKAYNSISARVVHSLVIVGGPSGETKHGSRDIDYYKKLAKSKKIEFTGRVEPGKVIEYYKNAYFSVFPSRYEPFGIVALESLACKTPFIASSGGFIEISRRTEGGLVFKTSSVKSLSKLLLRVDKEPQLRKKLVERAGKNLGDYEWKKISREYLNIFKPRF